MKNVSPAQQHRIAEVLKKITAYRAHVLRMESELQLCKDNLKLAKHELEFAYSDLDSITQEALAGFEPLPNIFDASAKKEAKG